MSPETFKTILDNLISDFSHNTLPWLLSILWNSYKPYIIGTISGLIAVGICIFVGKRVTRFFSQVEGDTKRETKRREKTTEHRIRTAFNIYDLINFFRRN